MGHTWARPTVHIAGVVAGVVASLCVQKMLAVARADPRESEQTRTGWGEPQAGHTKPAAASAAKAMSEWSSTDSDACTLPQRVTTQALPPERLSMLMRTREFASEPRLL